MLSLLGLLVRLLIASRRILAGWVVYLAGLGVLYAVPGPLDELYVATSAALVAVTIWLVISGFVSDRPTTAMLCAAAGGPLRFHLLQTAAGLTAAAPLGVIAVAAGRVVAGPAIDRPGVALGASTHLVALLVGAGIGAVAARPVMGDFAFSLTAAVGGFVLVVVAPGVSPLAPTLGNVTTGADDLLAAAAWCVLAAGWAALLAAAGGAVAARRRLYGSAAPQ